MGHRQQRAKPAAHEGQTQLGLACPHLVPDGRQARVWAIASPAIANTTATAGTEPPRTVAAAAVPVTPAAPPDEAGVAVVGTAAGPIVEGER